MFMLKYDSVLICLLLRRNGINFKLALKRAARSWQSAATYTEHAMQSGYGFERGCFPWFLHHTEFTDVTALMLEVKAEGSDVRHSFLICS